MLEQYTSLTFTGHTRGNAMEPFLWSGGPIGAPKGPQMAKNDNFGAIRGCCGSALAEQCGIKVEQVRAPQGRCNGTVSMVRGPVLKIWFGPPNADFWSVWSSQKARKFRQIQPTTKVRILCFEWKRIWGHSLRSIPFVMSGHLIFNFFQTLGLPIFNTNPNNGCPKRIYQHSGQAHKHFSHRFHGVSFLADVQT